MIFRIDDLLMWDGGAHAGPGLHARKPLEKHCLQNSLIESADGDGERILSDADKAAGGDDGGR